MPSSLIRWRGSSISRISASTSPAGQRRSINCSRAVCGSGAARISLITSSILATAIARPTRTCARSRALRSRIFGAAADDLLAEGDEGLQHVDQRQQFGLAAVQRHHVGAEGGLQRREAVELVQDHVGIGVALQLDDDAIALAVALVANVGDALDALVAHQLGHLLDHRRLVHLVGHLGDDDGFAIVAALLDVDAAAHDDRAAAGRVGAVDARAAEDDAAGREIRPGNDLHQRLQVDRRVVDQGDGAVDHFAEIVRRNVGRHADGDAARAVDQQVREARRQDLRLALGAVVVVLEIDRVLVDVVEQLVRDLRQARLGVAHRRRRIVVDRAEIALAVDERHAHRPVLRHAHQRVVDRGVAVRMVLAHHVADDARRLHMLAVPVVAALVHRVEDAAVHRLQPVAHVRQRAADDHAHRVIEIGALHLLDDRNRLDAGRRRRVPAVVLGRSKSDHLIMAGITSHLYRKRPRILQWSRLFSRR